MGTSVWRKMERTQKGEDRAKEKGGTMSEQRASEIARREEAQAHAGEIVAGSGQRGSPRRIARMVSVRLDGELVRELQNVAQQRNTTVSDLLREGAEYIVRDAYSDAVTLKVTKSEGAGWTIQKGQRKANVVFESTQMSSVPTTTTRDSSHQVKV